MTRIVLPDRPLIDGATALRPWHDADLGALVRACQDPEIPRWTNVPSPYGQSDGRAYLQARHDAIESAASAPFAIVAAENAAELLGSISLMRIAWSHARAEVGYWLAREARGQGHTVRAVGLICAWGVRALGVERFDLFAATGNLASQRVAERAGFRPEAVLRSYLQTPQGRLDVVAFGWLAADRTAGGVTSSADRRP